MLTSILFIDIFTIIAIENIHMRIESHVNLPVKSYSAGICRLRFSTPCLSRRKQWPGNPPRPFWPGPATLSRISRDPMRKAPIDTHQAVVGVQARHQQRILLRWQMLARSHKPSCDPPVAFVGNVASYQQQIALISIWKNFWCRYSANFTQWRCRWSRSKYQTL